MVSLQSANPSSSAYFWPSLFLFSVLQSYTHHYTNLSDAATRYAFCAFFSWRIYIPGDGPRVVAMKSKTECARFPFSRPSFNSNHEGNDSITQKSRMMGHTMERVFLYLSFFFCSCCCCKSTSTRRDLVFIFLLDAQSFL
jgi:hypothetical protein